MLPRTAAALAAPALLLGCISVAVAAPAGDWSGKATSSDGKTSYGNVTFTVKGSVVRDFRIERVAVSCDPGVKTILVPRARIKGNRLIAAYRPDPGVLDIISIDGTIRGRTVKGVFNEGPRCKAGGRFTARLR